MRKCKSKDENGLGVNIRLLSALSLFWATLVVWFVLDGNLFQAGVAVLASLGTLLLVWWYTTHEEQVPS
jgi:Flp pilus assembly protein TadB